MLLQIPLSHPKSVAAGCETSPSTSTLTTPNQGEVRRMCICLVRLDVLLTCGDASSLCPDKLGPIRFYCCYPCFHTATNFYYPKAKTPSHGGARAGRSGRSKSTAESPMQTCSDGQHQEAVTSSSCQSRHLDFHISRRLKCSKGGKHCSGERW